MKSGTAPPPHQVQVTLNADDAALVGATLRMLSRIHGGPDPMCGERLARVGGALEAAARKDYSTAADVAAAAAWITCPLCGHRVPTYQAATGAILISTHIPGMSLGSGHCPASGTHAAAASSSTAVSP